jgi:hypothetical protein
MRYTLDGFGSSKISKSPETILLAVTEFDITAQQESDFHPNRIPFSGVLTRVDQPSDRAPSGSQGHRVCIPRHVAQAALPTLVGMAVDISYNFKNHDVRKKVGVITQAQIDGDAIVVSGHLFGHDFPTEIERLQALSKSGELGMSFEITDVGIEDATLDVWMINHLIFTGAAILVKNAAAYQRTELAAAHAQKGEQVKQKFKDLADALVEMSASLDDSSDARESTHAAPQKEAGDMELLKSKIDALGTRIAAMSESDKGDEQQAASSTTDTPDAGAQDQQAASPGFKSKKGMLRSLCKDMLESMVMDSMKTGYDEDYDDDDDDVVQLFKRMMNMKNMHTSAKPETTSEADGLKQQVADLSAQVAQLAKLITDQQAGSDGDAGDAKETDNTEKEIAAANEKEVPARRTIPVDIAAFASKFGLDTNREEHSYTVAEIDKILTDKGITDSTQRIAAKHEMQAAGMLSGQ